MKQCCDRFVKDQHFQEVEFKYNNKKEKYIVCIGMLVTATQNIKDQEIFNTMEFNIENMTDYDCCVKNEWFTEQEFAENFIPSFCLTVYKYQGADINEPYNIHDVEKIRIKKCCIQHSVEHADSNTFILIKKKKKPNNKYKDRKQPIIELVNSRFNSLHKNGKKCMKSVLKILISYM